MYEFQMGFMGYYWTSDASEWNDDHANAYMFHHNHLFVTHWAGNKYYPQFVRCIKD